MLRIGIIGVGGLGTRHAQYVVDTGKGRPVAFADTDVARAEAAAEAHGGRAYGDFTQMLEREQLDAVFVCTPAQVRVEPIQAIAEHKLPFFCEKPPAATMADARACIDVIEQAGIINSVGFMYRWSQVTDRMRELLDGRSIGSCMIRGIWACAFWEMPGYYYIQEKSGGPIGDQGVHMIDAARYMMRDEVTAVHAFGSNKIIPKTDTFTIEDTVSTSLQFRSGTIGAYLHSWSHRGWVWEIDCIGEDFRLVWDLSDRNRLWGTIGEEEVSFEATDDYYVTEVEGFLDAVAANDQSMIRSSYADATKTLAAALAINRSIDSGQPATVDPNL